MFYPHILERHFFMEWRSVNGCNALMRTLNVTLDVLLWKHNWIEVCTLTFFRCLVCTLWINIQVSGLTQSSSSMCAWQREVSHAVLFKGFDSPVFCSSTKSILLHRFLYLVVTSALGGYLSTLLHIICNFPSPLIFLYFSPINHSWLTGREPLP
jgi:hypothetical protein